MTKTVRFFRPAFYIFFVLSFTFSAGEVLAQSTDEARPTVVASYPITGDLGSGTYYYSVTADPGNGKIFLEFRPPEGGGSMSVSLSGPDCCPAEAYVGADSGGAGTITRETEFSVPSRQTLLVTVYISVASGRTVRFSLNLGGTIGMRSGTSPPPTRPEYTLCTDLAILDGFNLSVAGNTRTISGEIRNLARAEFRSPANQQWIEVLDIAKLKSAPQLVRRIPFTDVAARGRLAFSATHTTTSTLTPRYKVRIVYSPANATDAVYTNDDCNLANNETLRYPTATL
jgi:hypothetical protein